MDKTSGVISSISYQSYQSITVDANGVNCSCQVADPHVNSKVAPPRLQRHVREENLATLPIAGHT
jgi:hypothetical protein